MGGKRIMTKQRVWITGACGFMGQHMADLLIEQGYEVLATTFKERATTDIKQLNKKARIEECDIRNTKIVDYLVKDFQPEKIFHLAAQSYPTVSWEEPQYTLETNVIGTTNVFEAVKKFAPDCKILNACSSAEYGFVNSDEVPILETHQLNPLHPYGVSKLAQEKLAYQYWKNFGVNSVSIRIFNTTGPKKVGDVCSDFTRRLVEIEKGKRLERILPVGNITTRRAIIDVRDTLNGFCLALDKGKMGEVYNLSGGIVYSMEGIINYLKEAVDFGFEIKQDSRLMRPTDEPVIYGDSSKIKNDTGWRQEILLSKTLKDMIDYWRNTL
jgi:GDP-4-dehydro-6-deoxy-D-mannose reductase